MTRSLFAAITLAIGLATMLPGSAGAAGLGLPCGHYVHFGCDPGLFCDFRPGQCGQFGELGVCRRKPTSCMQVAMPVCGCNYETFSNDCRRQAAGISLLRNNRCWF